MLFAMDPVTSVCYSEPDWMQHTKAMPHSIQHFTLIRTARNTHIKNITTKCLSVLNSLSCSPRDAPVLGPCRLTIQIQIQILAVHKVQWATSLLTQSTMGYFTFWLRLSLRFSLSLNFGLSTYLSQKVKWFRWVKTWPLTRIV